MDPCDPTQTDCDVTDGATLRFTGASDASDVSDASDASDASDVHTHREEPAMPETEPTPDATTTDAAPAPDATPAPDADTDTRAETQVPDAPTAGDLADLAASTGGNTGLTLALAVLAVVGGAAGWKFFSQIAEQKHEQAMKRLDIEAQAQGIGRAQPQACAAKHAELEARVEDVIARLNAVGAQADALTKKTASIDGDFDASDLERQVKRLSKTVKSLQEGSP
ncbi:MAG: hypothetical protein EBZ50_14075 [Alphaproteobacteria bacterium]|nr:hypothetical protein [Alphaproteobacteria bacterium]